jgi:hypothetical protein
MQVHRHVPSLNTSWVAGCLAGRCFRAIGKIGKPIWLVSLLLWMCAAGSLAGDSTAILRLAAEAWPTMLCLVRQKIARLFTYSPAFECAAMKCSG